VEKTRFEQALKRVVEMLKRLGAAEIWLFGSAAQSPDSAMDIDILAIFHGNEPYKAVMERVYSNFDLTIPVGCDIIAHSRASWQKVKNLPFWQHALKHAKRLFPRPDQSPKTDSRHSKSHFVKEVEGGVNEPADG